MFLDGVVLKIGRDTVAGRLVYLASGRGADTKRCWDFSIVGSEGESTFVRKDIPAEPREQELTRPILFIGEGWSALSKKIR